VFLVGFMASGKTTVGKELAQRLGWDFADLDSVIELRERRSVPEIFQDRGESGFRQAETRAIRDLLTNSPTDKRVVALGGGAFVQTANRALLQEQFTVFLEAPVAELWQRSLTDGIQRPLRGDPAQFARLYEERLPFYRQAKVTIVTSGKDVASLCAEIERTLQDWGETRAANPTCSPSVHLGTGESQ
jgi:shikimate kinase